MTNTINNLKGRIGSNLSFPTKNWYGDVEYKMPKLLSKSVIAAYKGEKKNIQDILCEYVNENCGIKGNCVRVITDL